MEEYKAVPSLWDLSKKFDLPINEVIKLDAGENQFGYSIKVAKALKKADLFNYYPDPEYKDLRKALALYTRSKMENIMIGSGSDELLDLLLRLILNENDEIINCPPTFGMYSILTKLNKGIVVSVPRKNDFSLDIKEILKKITSKTKAIFICSPNNPTGNIVNENEIITLLKTGKLIIVDEAYYEFCGKSAISLSSKYKNLIILRTFSKWAGIAGLRLGYGIMNEFLVKQILKIKPPYNVNLAAEIAGIAALEDIDVYKKVIRRIVSERKRMSVKLSKFNYLTVFPSETNFLFLRVNGDFQKLKNYLFSKKIIVRYYQSELTGNAIRLSIGAPQQNNKVLAVFDKTKKEKKYAFIDRDGTLIFEPQDTFQIDSIEKLKILEGVIQGLKELIKQGYELIMISNQDGLGTSSFPKTDFEAPQNKMLNIFEENGIKFAKIFICPHSPSKNCNCRKPKIGLVKKFLRDNQMNKYNSLVCGDRPTDKQFAKNIGIKFIPMSTNGDFYKALVKGEIIL